MFMYQKFSFKKFQKAIKKINYVPDDSDKYKREIEIINMFRKGKCVADIDWGSFTYDELTKTFEYLEQFDQVFLDAIKLSNLIKGFEKIKEKTTDVF